MIATDTTCLRRRLLAALYTDAMVLADDTRAYAEHQAPLDGHRLDPVDQVLLSCEQLRMTTLLMAVLAWLLAWRAVDAGEAGATASPRLDPLHLPGQAAAMRFPDQLRTLSEDVVALYRRAGFLDDAFGAAVASPASLARAIQHRLAAAL